MQLERTPIQISHCEKTYPDGTVALRATSLSIEPGEILALLGPSGCGKTTLLRIIAGLEKSDGNGAVWFGSENVTNVPVERRGIGMVFQHYALFPQMSVAANIAYGMRVRGSSTQETQRTVNELLELIDLNGFESKKPSELSGGQCQRVALARAIAVRPRVLLLDEPLTALDAKLKESLRDELAFLLRRLNITTIHVTHDQHEAMSIANRMAVMQSGKIVQVGTPEDLYRFPKHPFVASFLGKINTIPLSRNMNNQTGIFIDGIWLDCPTIKNKDTKILLRPEDIQVFPAQDMSTKTKVTHRVFLGDRVHLRVSTLDAGELLIDTTRDCQLQVGDLVKLKVQPEKIMICGDEE